MKNPHAWINACKTENPPTTKMSKGLPQARGCRESNGNSCCMGLSPHRFNSEHWTWKPNMASSPPYIVYSAKMSEPETCDIRASDSRLVGLCCRLQASSRCSDIVERKTSSPVPFLEEWVVKGITLCEAPASDDFEGRTRNRNLSKAIVGLEPMA